MAIWAEPGVMARPMYVPLDMDCCRASWFSASALIMGPSLFSDMEFDLTSGLALPYTCKQLVDR